MLLIVLGMSRSGTSLLMQVLHNAGFDCGSDFIASNENNLKGYFERMPVMGYNISLLEEAAGTNQTLFPLPTKEEIEQLVGQKPPPITFPKHDYAVKDPRFSLTLPVWLPHLEDYDLRIIFARRDETAIVESLVRAYNLDMPTGRSITREYLNRARDVIERYDLKHTEIYYEDWFENPQRNLQNLEELIGRPLHVDLEHILNPELRHCKKSTSHCPNPIVPFNTKIYFALNNFVPQSFHLCNPVLPKSKFRLKTYIQIQ